MSTTILDSMHWGDRTRLLPRKMGYALSLDFEAKDSGAQMRITPGGRLRHLFDRTLVTAADGATGDVPIGLVRWGDIEIGGVPGAPESWIGVRLLIGLQVPTAPSPASSSGGSLPSLTFEGKGVLNLDGGPSVLRSPAKKLRGSVFMASNHQSSIAAYRWLDRRQLFGVGVVEGTRQAREREWNLQFNFDLYTAA